MTGKGISLYPPPVQENDPRDKQEHEYAPQDRSLQNIFFLISVQERPEQENRREERHKRDPEEFVRNELHKLIGCQQVPCGPYLGWRPERIGRDIGFVREKQRWEKGDDKEHDREVGHHHVHLFLEKGGIIRIAVGMYFPFVF